VNYRGRAKGSTIELAERLPFPDGQSLCVSVEAWPVPARRGSPAAVRQAMHGPPHLEASAMAALESAIADGKIPVSAPWTFNEGK
jgi:hypothetical protein